MKRAGPEMQHIYLGLGSNKGNRLAFIKEAIDKISMLNATTVLRVSSVYETEPWGMRDQNLFLNCAAEISSELDALVLSSEFKEVERIIGRTNSSKWHEREIDIDMLFFGNMVINSEKLKVPHAELSGRNFVLVPMKELAPDFVHPVSGRTISQLLKDSTDSLKVNFFTTLSLTN